MSEKSHLLSSISDAIYWRLAWLCLLLAICLRLYLFSGYGLGDDSNETAALISFADNLRLNPKDFAHYRVVNVLLRGFLFHYFSVAEKVLILPVLIFALFTHIATMLFAGELFGARGAFFTSLLFLITPYETLCSTANIPDYFHSFFGIVCAWSFYRGYQRNSSLWMIVAVLAFGLGILSRLSILLLLPPLAIGSLIAFRKVNLHLWFWGGLLLFFTLLSAWDFQYSGSPVGWYFNNSGGGGVDVTDLLDFVLMVYPRYLFYQDDYQNWMFGLSGWTAALGALLALAQGLRRGFRPAEIVVVLAFFVFLGLFEFMPHRLTIERYYSHSRIFRYLAQISPVIYLSGGYLFSELSSIGTTKNLQRVTLAILCFVSAFGLWQTPKVNFPLRDASADGRELIAYLRQADIRDSTDIYTDYWRLFWISGMLHPHYRRWRLHGVTPDSDDEKRTFLSNVKNGVVITGGATLSWYSGPDLIISLSRLNFKVPAHWELIHEIARPNQAWREEPLRVWKVESSYENSH